MRDGRVASLIAAVLIFPAFCNGFAKDSADGSVAGARSSGDRRDNRTGANSDGAKAAPPITAYRKLSDAQAGASSAANDLPDAKSPSSQGNAQSTQGATAAANSAGGVPPTKLHCRATRTDLGMYEPLRVMSITVDPAKKYVKVIHEGDGHTLEFIDGSTSAQGQRNFVKVTDETIVYGQGRETWKIDRYTGTLTSAVIAIPFECQVRPSERKF